MNLVEVFDEFDKWVDSKAEKVHPIISQYKGYLPPDETFGVMRAGQELLPNQHIPYGIQQVEKEIKELCSQLTGYENCLDLGMGQFGGTHKLFSLLFNKTVTVELMFDVMMNYRSTNQIDYSKEVFILGSTYDEKTVNQVAKYAPFDLLFIDTIHTYDITKLEYSLYSNMVKNGGIIAFHDTKSKKYGVSKFIEELKNGEFDSTKHEINNIWHSNEVGISYEIHR